MANLEQISMCRTCLSFKGNMYPVFGENDSQIAVAGMAVPNFLAVFINNKISPADNCPNKICGSCLQQIDNFLLFKRNCEEAQSKLNAFLVQHITPHPDLVPQKVKPSILSISYILPPVIAEHQYDLPDQSISSIKSTSLQNNQENLSQKCQIPRNRKHINTMNTNTNSNNKNKSNCLGKNYRRRFNAASTKPYRIIASNQHLLRSPFAKRKKITQIETNIKDQEGDKNKDQIGCKDSIQTHNQNHEKDIYETSEVLATIIVNYETGEDSDIMENVLSQRREDVSENTSEELLVPLILTKNNAGDVDEELDETNNIVDIKIEPYEINDSASTVNIAQDAEMAECETTQHSDLMEKKYETYRQLKQNVKDTDNNSETLHRCENCAKICRGIDDIRRHILVDHTKEQFCMICKEVIDGDISYHCVEHISLSTYMDAADEPNSVRSERLHKCEICNKMFSTSWQLAWHSVIHKKKTDIDPTLIQRKSKPINAEVCETVTAKKNSSIKISSLLLGYKCEICSMVCESKLKLMEHVEIAHNTSKPSKCPFCSMKFQLHNEITAHLKKCYLKSRLALV